MRGLHDGTSYSEFWLRSGFDNREVLRGAARAASLRGAGGAGRHQDPPAGDGAG